MPDSLRPHELQHVRLLCPLLFPRVCPNSCTLSGWCYLTISASAAPFSFCLQSLLASGSMRQLFTSGSQSTGASASASVLPMNIQCWSPLGWTGGISLQSRGLSRVFSKTTVQKHQLFRGLPFPPPEDLPDSGIKPVSLVSPALAGEFFTSEPFGKGHKYKYSII